MPPHRSIGMIAAGVIVVASCARTEPRPPLPAAPAIVEAAAPPDADNDGVPDDVDRCPSDPEDCDGFQDADGCPDEDNDQDGFPDYCDVCPDTPGRHTKNGCPIIILDSQTIRLLLTASFERNGTKPSFPQPVDALVEVSRREQIKRFGLVGHSLAAEKDGAKLAMRRAEAVKKALVALGVVATKIELRAAPAGNVEDCAPAPDGTRAPCVTIGLVDSEWERMEWDGVRYVPPPRVPDEHVQPADCRHPQPKQTVGRPCQSKAP